MTPERLHASTQFSVASRIPFTHPETLKPDTDPAPIGPDPAQPSPPVVPRAAVAPALVGIAITGREWVVMQVPGGAVRGVKPMETEARALARALALEEGGAFGIFQPKGIIRPQTTVIEEPIDP